MFYCMFYFTCDRSLSSRKSTFFCCAVDGRTARWTLDRRVRRAPRSETVRVETRRTVSLVRLRRRSINRRDGGAQLSCRNIKAVCEQACDVLSNKKNMYQVSELQTSQPER